MFFICKNFQNVTDHHKPQFYKNHQDLKLSQQIKIVLFLYLFLFCHE